MAHDNALATVQEWHDEIREMQRNETAEFRRANLRLASICLAHVIDSLSALESGITITQ